MHDASTAVNTAADIIEVSQRELTTTRNRLLEDRVNSTELNFRCAEVAGFLLGIVCNKRVGWSKDDSALDHFTRATS